MKCERVLELLSDYIDGELSSAGVLGVQAHLRSCPECEQEHQGLRRTVQLVALFGRQEAPVDCRDAIMARIRELPATPAPMGWPSWRELFSLRTPAVPTTWVGAPARRRFCVVWGVPSWARTAALAGIAVASISAGMLFVDRDQELSLPAPSMRLAQDEYSHVRESSQLLQALGRDDGYILAADIPDEYR